MNKLQSILVLTCLFVFGRLLNSLPVVLHIFLCVIIYMFEAIANNLDYFNNHPKNESDKIKFVFEKPWFQNPDIEKADWANYILKALWPHVKHEIQNYFNEISETVTMDYFPLGFKLEFNPMHMDNLKIVGVKILDVHERHKIVLDVFIEYFSDSVLLLHLFTKMRIINCSVKLKRLDLKGTFRLECLVTNINGLPEVSRILLSSIDIPLVDISLGRDGLGREIVI